MRVISVDALKDLEEMEYIYFKSPAAVPFYEADKVWDVIDNAPIIEAEPLRHGRWKHNEDYEEWAERYVCSECGRNALTDGDYRSELSPYCPNCGAKMVKKVKVMVRKHE